MPGRSSVRSRQREQRLDARKRILDACHELLEEQAWSEVRLEDVMTRAGLSRTAFYRHFEDRGQLLIALLEELGIELALTADPWQQSTQDHHQALRAGLANLTRTYERHGRIMRAISETAGYDAELAERYQQLAERLIAGVEARLTEEVAEGRTSLADPHETARALVWLNERYLTETFGRRPFAAEPEAAVQALFEIWAGTLYPGTPPSGYRRGA